MRIAQLPNNFTSNVKGLDTTKRGGAVKAEAAYAGMWKPYARLKRKYTPESGAYSQFGCGGDYSGKAQQKAKTAKTKAANKPMVMRVNGRTGHSVMQEVK